MWCNNNNKTPAWQSQDVRVRYKEFFLFFFSSKANLLIHAHEKAVQGFRENRHRLQTPMQCRQGWRVPAAGPGRRVPAQFLREAAARRRDFRGPGRTGADRGRAAPEGGRPTRGGGLRGQPGGTPSVPIAGAAAARRLPRSGRDPRDGVEGGGRRGLREKPLTATPQRRASRGGKSPRCPKPSGTSGAPIPRTGVPSAARGCQAGPGDPRPDPMRPPSPPNRSRRGRKEGSRKFPWTAGPRRRLPWCT